MVWPSSPATSSRVMPLCALTAGRCSSAALTGLLLLAALAPLCGAAAPESNTFARVSSEGRSVRRSSTLRKPARRERRSPAFSGDPGLDSGLKPTFSRSSAGAAFSRRKNSVRGDPDGDSADRGLLRVGTRTSGTWTWRGSAGGGGGFAGTAAGFRSGDAAFCGDGGRLPVLAAAFRTGTDGTREGCGRGPSRSRCSIVRTWFESDCTSWRSSAVSPRSSLASRGAESARPIGDTVFPILVSSRIRGAPG